MDYVPLAWVATGVMFVKKIPSLLPLQEGKKNRASIAVGGRDLGEEWHVRPKVLQGMSLAGAYTGDEGNVPPRFRLERVQEGK